MITTEPTRGLLCVCPCVFVLLRACISWLRTGHVREVGLAGWKQTSMCATVAKMLKSRKLLTWHYQTNGGQEIKFGWLYECMPLLRPCWVTDYSQLMSFYIIYSMYISPTHSVFLQTAKPHRSEFKGWMEIKSFLSLRTYDRPWQTLWIRVTQCDEWNMLGRNVYSRYGREKTHWGLTDKAAHRALDHDD